MQFKQIKGIKTEVFNGSFLDKHGENIISKQWIEQVKNTKSRFTGNLNIFIIFVLF